MSKNPFTDHSGTPIVYVRQVTEAEMPDELRGTTARLYSVHDADGNRLAMTQDRRIAFALAKRNDMVPVSVH